MTLAELIKEVRIKKQKQVIVNAIKQTLIRILGFV